MTADTMKDLIRAAVSDAGVDLGESRWEIFAFGTTISCLRDSPEEFFWEVKDHRARSLDGWWKEA